MRNVRLLSSPGYGLMDVWTITNYVIATGLTAGIRDYRQTVSQAVCDIHRCAWGERPQLPLGDACIFSGARGACGVVGVRIRYGP